MMMAYRELTASEITNEVLLNFRTRGWTVWRQNNLTYGKRKNIATPGIPDIIGYAGSGIFIGCEVKKIGDTFKKAQKDFLLALDKSGGYAFYATQEKDKVVIKKMNDYVEILCS